MTFSQFVEWVFYGVLAGGTIQVVNVISRATASIENLNKNVAILIEKIAWHEKQIERHDMRIQKIEEKI